MGVRTVKWKVPRRWGTLAPIIAAFAAICAAWAGLIPETLVEEWYSRRIFPVITRILAPLARLVPFSWLDVVIPAALIGLVWLAARRRIWLALTCLSLGYLFFFLTWGLNYQRMPLVSRLDYRESEVTDAAVEALRREAAARLNALYEVKERSLVSAGAVDREAALRVAGVVRELDGLSFPRPAVKTSRILNPIFRAGGTSGMFNPFPQEALIAEPLLDVERPIIVMHEIAHVLGYANEGEANFIAFLGAIHSRQPIAEYSGWLYLWLYLRSRNADDLLDSGPRADLEAIYARSREDRVEWVSQASGRTLDAFLRANRVQGGVRSYSEIVRLAVGTRGSWSRFDPGTSSGAVGADSDRPDSDAGSGRF